MIYKADYIAARLREGKDVDAIDPLIITPIPDLDALEASGSASVDLRLGTWFMTLRQARMTHLAPDDEMPESHPQLTKTHYVRFGSRYILHPRNFVLSSTLEWIRLPKDMAAYVIGRSSWGRRGLIIATATGVHPCFTGCLTLELTNVGELPICIYPGMTICQLFFHEIKPGESGAIDHSQFVCSRKPSVGTIRLKDDAFAWKLANAYRSRPGNRSRPAEDNLTPTDQGKAEAILKGEFPTTPTDADLVESEEEQRETWELLKKAMEEGRL